jgi:predicted ATPase
VRIHASLLAWYELCGYRVATVPNVSVVERCGFVLSTLNAGDA